MPRFTTMQQRFTQGEIDPLMLARGDIDQYYGGMAAAKDILTLPQGGFKRRPGLEYIDRVLGVITKIDPASITATAPRGGTANNAKDQDNATDLVTVTPMGTLDPYVISHFDLGSAQDIGTVYIDDLSIDIGSTDEVFLQVSTDDATWISVGEALSVTTTAKDYTRRVHGSYRYVRLARVGTTDLGAAVATLAGMDITTEAGLSESRCVEFEFNVEQAYKMVFTDKNVAIYQGRTYLIDIYMADLPEGLLNDIDYEYDGDTLLIFHGDVQTIKLTRNGANDAWLVDEVTYENIPRHLFGQTVLTEPAGTLTISDSGDTGVRKVTGSGTAFDASYVGQYINAKVGTRVGRARVASVESTTAMTIVVLTKFSDPTLATTQWELESGYDEIWSDAKGWPKHGRFYQGRLYVDGGKSRPSVAYGSKVNLFFNFDFGTALDDEAIGPLTQSYDEITGIYPGRSLMFFTTGAEYIIPQTFGDPITPGNAVMTRQTSIGSEVGFRPQEVEGGVMYVQSGGASIQELIYDDSVQAFGNNFVSLLSSHLIDDPKDFALRKATSTEEGAYLLLVKGDGNLTIANILRNQGITSFVEHRTDGKYKKCGVDISDMYFIIEREIGGTAVQYLERYNNSHYMDSSVMYDITSDTDTFTGLDHLEGESCRVLADGSLQDDETVASGSITIGRDATTSLEAGLNFTPIMTDLPAETEFQSEATMMGRKMNISEITLRLKDTGDIIVNDKPVTFQTTGPAGAGSPLDETPPRFTGVRRLRGWRGWLEDAQVTIKQDDPLPMTVLAIKKRMNT